MQVLLLVSILLLSHLSNGYLQSRSLVSTKLSNRLHLASVSTLIQQQTMPMSSKEPEKTGLEWLQEKLEKAEKDANDPKSRKRKGPPIYQPGPFSQHLLASSAYLIPIVDAADLGKYMFAAYPEIGTAFNTVFGTVSAIYNGVPFLPFAIFFIMSYIARAPSFPVEVRFHFAQAFMVSLVQFLPSLLFGVMEKAGVPGMAVLYNTGRKHAIMHGH
jgi:hypothetical protein